MPYYEDINNSYLDKAVTRLIGICQLASPDKTQVVTYIDPQMTPPFWWLYPGPLNPIQLATEIESQPYEIVGRYVLGYTNQGYDGNLGIQLWTVLPTVCNFINGHKNLIWDDEQTQIPYLLSGWTRARQLTGFGALQGYSHLGIEISISLKFTVQIEQRW